MENIKMWHHPKYYKELRKRNKTGVTATTKRDIGHSKELSFGFPPPVTSDQAISFESGTPPNERASDPGLKQRDSQVVNQVKLSSQSQAASLKQQAASAKLQAALEAPSNKLQKKI